MGRIQLLPDSLINRIAAGEVVERPASVIKELIENSLDAGAASIRIVVESGGKRSILVQDDGQGMDRDDALLSIERHATSKLRDVADLQSIRTLGFRGEALSSIASVSQFSLKSVPESGAGSEIRVRGGRIEAVEETGGARGTTIRVERLFFNVPARRKFLRTDATELTHVVRLVTRCALAQPAVRLSLAQAERVLLDVPAGADTADRIRSIYGQPFIDKLLPVLGDEPGVRLTGFAGRPTEAWPRRDVQHFFVNGRAVQDRSLSHAVASAYGNTMPRGRFPAVLLFLQIRPDDVDVNVHPQKTEVRFRQSRQIHDLVRDALVGGLSASAAVPDLVDLRPGQENRRAGVARATLGYLSTHETSPAFGGGASATTGGAGVRAAARAGATGRLLAAAAPAGLAATEPEAPTVTVLAQYRDSYVVAQDAEGLMLIDQHAAHERVLFERYLAAAGDDRVEVQRLLFPVTVELPTDEALLVEAQGDEFRRLGFLIEPFGGRTFRVDGVPLVAADMPPEQLLRDLAGEAARARSVSTDVDEVRRKVITTAACHAAIKINHPLSAPQMQRLVDDLFRVTNPTTCPHGRPALFRLSHDELERAFRRR